MTSTEITQAGTKLRLGSTGGCGSRTALRSGGRGGGSKTGGGSAGGGGSSMTGGGAARRSRTVSS